MIFLQLIQAHAMLLYKKMQIITVVNSKPAICTIFNLLNAPLYFSWLKITN